MSYFMVKKMVVLVFLKVSDRYYYDSKVVSCIFVRKNNTYASFRSV